MSRHHENAENLCNNADSETQNYIFNQTMLNSIAISSVHIIHEVWF